MERDIHDIYDVILKIIAATYGETFLRYIGIDKKMKKSLNVELTTIKGSKLYVDFLCELNDDTLCHIEFQYPNTKSKDLDRFFNYNITTQVRYQKLTETYIFNFTDRKTEEEIRAIGKTKYFKPYHFYLGDIDFEKRIEKINIKSKSNEKLTEYEEITLMLICLQPKYDKAKYLKKINKLLKNEEIFYKERSGIVKQIINLEIQNLLTPEEQKEIYGEIKMNQREQDEIILNAIKEVNQKVISETLSEGKSEGLKEGVKKGKETVARNLKGKMDIQEISESTGLSIADIEKL